MKKRFGLMVYLSLSAGMLFAGETSFWRVCGTGTSAITDVTADGHIAWTNASGGQIVTIQQATSLEPANWTHYTSVLSTETGNSYRVLAPETPDYLVIDLSEGPGATNYPVSYLSVVPPGGWTDAFKTTNLVMRRISAGTFIMGGRSTDYPGASDDGLHQVTLTKDFYIGVFEVTQKQWERVMGNWPSMFTNVMYRESRPVDAIDYTAIRGNANWPTNSLVHTNSFMGRLRSKTGLSTLDLPTESQWEFACRAGTTAALNSEQNLTMTFMDPSINVVGRYWHNGGSGWSQSGDTSVGSAKVGSYEANAWGLYDMHGNMWEWCLDWYGTYPGTVTDPLGPTGNLSYSYRVVRGGSWGKFASDCTAGFRKSYWSYYTSSDIGFRAVLHLGQQ